MLAALVLGIKVWRTAALSILAPPKAPRHIALRTCCLDLTKLQSDHNTEASSQTHGEQAGTFHVAGSCLGPKIADAESKMLLGRESGLVR